jgi:hypothetical protein
MGSILGSLRLDVAGADGFGARGLLTLMSVKDMIRRTDQYIYPICCAMDINNVRDLSNHTLFAHMVLEVASCRQNPGESCLPISSPQRLAKSIEVLHTPEKFVNERAEYLKGNGH